MASVSASKIPIMRQMSDAAASGGRPLDFSTSRTNGVATLRIQGELDVISCPDVRPTIDALIAARHPRVVIDLSGLRLIDSAGVGALVFLCKKVREYGGVVTVHGLGAQPLMIFNLLRLDRVLATWATFS
jgi:anti-sigma B factor antagonist